jgi:hydroxyacylglutathione hydrolase
MQSWFTVQQMADQIYAIHDNGNVMIYLIIGSRKALLVDTGWGIGDLGALVRTITDLPLEVVNTHGHPDHVGGGYQFPLIHIHETDWEILNGCFTEEYRKMDLSHLPMESYPPGFDPEQWVKAKLNRVIPLSEGHCFDLGNKRLEVLSIPGHTPGSIGLLDREQGILFSGDSVIEGTIWMHLDHSLSLHTFLQSLKRITGRSAPLQMILPGHAHIPAAPGVIEELIAGIEAILDGRLRGEAHHTFAGDGLLCEFRSCGIVYNPEKLCD